MVLADRDTAAARIRAEGVTIRPRVAERLVLAAVIGAIGLGSAAFAIKQGTEHLHCTPHVAGGKWECTSSLERDWRLIVVVSAIDAACLAALVSIVVRLSERVDLDGFGVTRRNVMRRQRHAWATIRGVVVFDRPRGQSPQLAVMTAAGTHRLPATDATSDGRGTAIVQAVRSAAAPYGVPVAATRDDLLFGASGATRYGVRHLGGRSVVNVPYQALWSFLVWAVPFVPAMMATDGFNLWTRPNDRAGLPEGRAYLVLVMLTIGTVLVQARIVRCGVTFDAEGFRVRHLLYNRRAAWSTTTRVRYGYSPDRAGRLWPFLKMRTRGGTVRMRLTATSRRERARAIAAAVGRYAPAHVIGVASIPAELVGPIRWEDRG